MVPCFYITIKKRIYKGGHLQKSLPKSSDFKYLIAKYYASYFCQLFKPYMPLPVKI